MLCFTANLEIEHYIFAGTIAEDVLAGLPLLARTQRQRVKRKTQLCFLRQLARLSEMTVGRRGGENRSCKISPRQFI